MRKKAVGPSNQTRWKTVGINHHIMQVIDEVASLGVKHSGLMAEGTAKGRPRSALDTIIAAIAEANDCIVVVTDNEKDFADIEIVNPIQNGNLIAGERSCAVPP